FPTLGELASITAPEGSEGRSLVPVLGGRETQARPDIFTAYTKVQAWFSNWMRLGWLCRP
ncbi:MAG TPA: hypothetical protein VFD27_20025, partial [Chthoniobacteraceae bacterium]|nr:hypothetical protein [Chthoniobacteraceae bacterium]